MSGVTVKACTVQGPLPLNVSGVTVDACTAHGPLPVTSLVSLH